MTDREKLIELVCESTNHDCGKHCNLSSASSCFSCTCVADHLLANGVTVQEWIKVEDEKLDEFVSVLGHMTDAGDFPAVRECYWTGDSFFFPALHEKHPVDRWMEMPE